VRVAACQFWSGAIFRGGHTNFSDEGQLPPALVIAVIGPKPPSMLGLSAEVRLVIEKNVFMHEGAPAAAHAHTKTLPRRFALQQDHNVTDNAQSRRRLTENKYSDLHIMNIQRSRGRTIMRMSSSVNWKSPGTRNGSSPRHQICGNPEDACCMDMRDLFCIILTLRPAARRLPQMHL